MIRYRWWNKISPSANRGMERWMTGSAEFLTACGKRKYGGTFRSQLTSNRTRVLYISRRTSSSARYPFLHRVLVSNFWFFNPRSEFYVALSIFRLCSILVMINSWGKGGKGEKRIWLFLFSIFGWQYICFCYIINYLRRKEKIRCVWK